MTKESRYELQKIDCNCNDCGYLVRDIKAYEEAVQRDKDNDRWLFDNKKSRAIEKALGKKKRGKSGWEEALKQAHAMQYVYVPAVLLLRGSCSKKGERISFQPNTLQLETQDCFVHRKDLLTAPAGSGE